MDDLNSDLQISLLLKGGDAQRFRAYKRRESLMKDAEAGRKLILERLTEVEATAGDDVRRKPMAKADMKRALLETMRDLLEEAG